MRYFTGLVEVLTLEDEFATFVVFSLLGFAGLLLFVLAFRVALPNVDTKRYALLLLFWPSLVYWPSSIGKESLMLLCLGLVAFGAARVLQGRAHGLLIAAFGLLGSGLIRPHVSLIAVTAKASITAVTPRPMTIAVRTSAEGTGSTTLLTASLMGTASLIIGAVPAVT